MPLRRIGTVERRERPLAPARRLSVGFAWRAARTKCLKLTCMSTKVSVQLTVGHQQERTDGQEGKEFDVSGESRRYKYLKVSMKIAGWSWNASRFMFVLLDRDKNSPEKMRIFTCPTYLRQVERLLVPYLVHGS